MNEHDLLTIQLIIECCESNPTFVLPESAIATIRGHAGLSKALTVKGVEIIHGKLVKREGN